MYWTIPETCIAVVGACLPTLRPLFYGWSPESIIGSVRSALSLNSHSSKRSKTSSVTTGRSRTGANTGSESIRGLSASNEYEIPPVPVLPSQGEHRTVKQSQLESQVSVHSSDDRMWYSGLNDEL